MERWPPVPIDVPAPPAIFSISGKKPLDGDYIQPFDVYHAERQVKRKRWQVHPDSIAELKKVVHQKLALRNILGKIEGKNPNEIVIIGAHYDHIGYDPMLEGDQIYNGADDNASGVQAVLQVARKTYQQNSKHYQIILKTAFFTLSSHPQENAHNSYCIKNQPK